ncbi:MAG: hypothetical protein QM820_35900 [Minicystis sp.]
MPRNRRRLLHITVVADNPETVDGLTAYFNQADAPAHGARALREVAEMPASTTAVVLFPDDFAFTEVITTLDAIRRRRPQLLVVLVTREPHRFEAACERSGEAVPVLLLPKPSFGWSILDAVRSHAVPDRSWQ